MENGRRDETRREEQRREAKRSEEKRRGHKKGKRGDNMNQDERRREKKREETRRKMRWDRKQEKRRKKTREDIAERRGEEAERGRERSEEESGGERSEGEEKRVKCLCTVCRGEQRCLGGRKKKASFGFHKNHETPKTAHATEREVCVLWHHGIENLWPYEANRCEKPGHEAHKAPPSLVKGRVI